jgi:hypothetical protein
VSLYQLGRRAAVHPIGYRPITHYGALLDAPPVFDRTNGFNGFRVLGNGPDPTLTVNHGKPVGDCAFVGTENVTVVDQIECGEPPTFPTSDLVVSTYLTYDHGQDKGANLSELLAYWHNHGLPWAGKNCGYASANFRDIDEFWAAVYAFGCGYIGILVTEAMQQQTAAGEPWDITGTDMDERVVGGHCVVPIARTSAEGDGEVATWGMRQPFTARWFKTFVEEAHVVVTPAQKARGGNGAGIDFEHLERDLAVVERLARGA